MLIFIIVEQVVNASSGSIIPQGAQVLRAVTIQGKQSLYILKILLKMHNFIIVIY